MPHASSRRRPCPHREHRALRALRSRLSVTLCCPPHADTVSCVRTHTVHAHRSTDNFGLRTRTRVSHQKSTSAVHAQNFIYAVCLFFAPSCLYFRLTSNASMFIIIYKHVHSHTQNPARTHSLSRYLSPVSASPRGRPCGSLWRVCTTHHRAHRSTCCTPAITTSPTGPSHARTHAQDPDNLLDTRISALGPPEPCPVQGTRSAWRACGDPVAPAI